MILQSVHEEILTRNERIVDAHQRDALASYELTSSLRSSLESLLGGDMASLSQNMENFDASLVRYPVHVQWIRID